MLVLMSWSAGAYSGGGGTCNCGDGTTAFGGNATNACTDCTTALNDATNCANRVNYVGTVAISNYAGTCINNPANFNNKVFDCQGHTIDGNKSGYGIYLNNGGNVTIKNCNVMNYWEGVYLESSSNNTLINNNLNSNAYGIYLNASSNNFIYHNNFVDNQLHIYDMSWDVPWYVTWYVPSINTWDDGAGKGNYWSDYEYKYPDAEELDGTGIWDTPYIIDENNKDNYSIVPEFSSIIILPLFMTITLLAIIIRKRKQSIHPCE